MMCVKCGQKPAAVHMQQIINGEKKEIFLCVDCAGENEVGISFGNLFQGFLDSFFDGQQNYNVNVNNPSGTKSITCKTCGLSYNDFKKTSKIGCADCYNEFKDELKIILKNIQGSNDHEGKFPSSVGQEYLQKRNIENLRLQLRKAIDTEQYEKAAEIRDQIKEIERGIANG